MSIHSSISNKKRPDTQKKRNQLKRLNKRDRKARQGIKQGSIRDADLITIHHLRKRKSDPKCNITLSGKKRRKLLKQIQYSKADKSKMEVEVVQTKTKKKIDTVKTDAEMMEVAN